MKSKIIVKFIQKDEGVEVNIYPTETINVLIGVAETIQMITKHTKESRKSVMSDINNILDILEEKEKKGRKENE